MSILIGNRCFLLRLTQLLVRVHRVIMMFVLNYRSHSTEASVRQRSVFLTALDTLLIHVRSLVEAIVRDFLYPIPLSVHAYW